MGSAAVVPSGNIAGMEKSYLFQWGYMQLVGLVFVGGGAVQITSYISSKQFRCWE